MSARVVLAHGEVTVSVARDVGDAEVVAALQDELDELVIDAIAELKENLKTAAAEYLVVNMHATELTELALNIEAKS